MIILHVSTGAGGGAHRASKRLAESQSRQGDQVIFVDSLSSHLQASQTNRFRFIRLRALSAAVSRFNRLITKNGPYYLTPISVSRLNLRSIIEINPDIVHIHNWFNILSIREMQVIAKRFPLVLTMHDERMLTGGCHYTFGCRNFIEGCRSCPASRFIKVMPTIGHKEIKDLLSEGRISLITPSRWLFEKAQNSLGKNLLHLSEIGNIQDDNFNKPYKAFLDSKMRVFTFVAAEPANPVKGLNILLDALDLVQSKTDIEIKLNIVGKRIQEFSKRYEIEQHGLLDGERIRKILQKTDFTLVPSLQENSPSVIVESMLTGTPVIATNVGGIPELVIEGVTGYTTNPDAFQLSEAILKAINLKPEENELMRLNTYKSTQLKFSADNLLVKIRQHYETIIRLHKDYSQYESL